MTMPDLACRLDPKKSSLITGSCLCIFHATCAKKFFNGNEYECPRCTITNTDIVHITNRTCLLCPSYSVTCFCPNCLRKFINILKQKASEQGQVCIVDEIKILLFEAGFKENLLNIYIACYAWYIN